MKAVCIIASDNVVIDGDVVFNKPDESGTIFAYYVDRTVNNLTIENSCFAVRWSKHLGFKLSILWFWHMVILRKSHVYLTGVLK